MNKFLLGMGGAALAVLAAGCGPELAQVATGADDLEWKEFAADSYSGYRPPRVTSPAVKDKYQGQINPAGAADDPAEASEDPVDTVKETAAPVPSAEEKQGEKEQLISEETPEKPAVTPAVEEAVPAPAEEEKKADKTEAAPKTEEVVDIEGETYTVKPGDTLSGIAKQFYKDGNLSGIIFKANSKVLKNPNSLRPGMKLLIPKM